jgi:hypothetical protein
MYDNGIFHGILLAKYYLLRWTKQKCISVVPVPINIDLTTQYCIKTAFVTTQKCISVVPVPINIDLTTQYCIKTAISV